jgi:hypothetical protein
MNVKSFTFVAIVLSTAFATARAESPTADPYLQTLGTQSRAAVVGERDAAIARGDIAAMTGEDSGAARLALHHAPGAATRAEVRAELRQARASGELGAMYGEDSGSFFIATHRRAETHGARVAQATR